MNLINLNYEQMLRVIKFPVYVVSNEIYDAYTQDGLLLLNEKVLDDSNQSGDTIGKRRLQTPHPLAKLTLSCEEFIDTIKSGHTTFIDTNGCVFRYTKTEYTIVKAIKITSTVSKDTHTLLGLRGVNFFIPVKRPPLGMEYAHMLHLKNQPWLLYDFSVEKVAPYKRKI